MNNKGQKIITSTFENMLEQEKQKLKSIDITYNQFI